MGLDESGTLAALKEHRGTLIDPKIAEYGGRIVKTTGDGVLLEFPSVVDAVRCAVDVQRGMADRNAGIPPDRRLDFRIGINVGDIIIDDGDIFGDGVNVAARLEALADRGGICVSRVVRDQVLDKLNFTFEDLGSQQVKNIARPVDVFRVDFLTDTPQAHGQARRHFRLQHLTGLHHWRKFATGVLAAGVIGIAAWQMWPYLRPSPANAPPPLSIAVIPFTVHGGGTSNEELARALTLDVTAKLGKAKRASVASESRVSSLMGKAMDALAIARELDVRYLVEGELRAVGSQRVITAHVIDAASGANVWSERMEIGPALSDDAHSALVNRLSDRLDKAIYDAEIRRVRTRPMPDNAIDLTLRGDAALYDADNDVQKSLAARRFYDEALRIEPSNLPALKGLAMLLDSLLTEDLGVEPVVFAQRVEELDRITSREVLLDSANPLVWYWRAEALIWLGRLDEALAANAKFQALEPLNPIALAQRSSIMLGADRPEEAVALAARAIATEPFSPVSGLEGVPLRAACESNILLGRFSDAASACERAAARDAWWVEQKSLAAVYAQLGESERANLAKTALLKAKPGYTIDKQKAADPFARNPAYLQRAESTLYAGLRKAGLPDR
jgi:adenylate cyclase